MIIEMKLEKLIAEIIPDDSDDWLSRALRKLIDS